ncbi:MAG: metabolite traffic protein EboE [Methylococcales bacterium]
MSWKPSWIGYCSNVHPGESSSLVEDNIKRFTNPLRQARGLASMQHGLWLSEQACNDYVSDKNKLERLKNTLFEHKLSVVTLNAFPVGNFHAERVKQAVYRPHWGEVQRLEYTRKAAQLLAMLLSPEEHFGTLSTLPLGYAQEWTDKDHARALNYLCEIVITLVTLENDTGKHIQLCLEMEPGCVLQETSQLIDFFQQQLPPVAKLYGLSSNQLHRHLGICFDVCHQAVMYENIDDSLQTIVNAGISIGKIQISSALSVSKPNLSEVKSWLSEFAESRYLHQVTGLTSSGDRIFCDDLELALNDQRFSMVNEWRIHFHVPVHKSNLGNESGATTSAEINTVFMFLSKNPQCLPHLELETYSWGVLPEQHRPNNDAELITGLQAELAFIEAALKQYHLLEEVD